MKKQWKVLQLDRPWTPWRPPGRKVRPRCQENAEVGELQPEGFGKGLGVVGLGRTFLERWQEQDLAGGP